MQEKYLPIGSIVRVKNFDKKIMIIGYYSLEYLDSFVMYDYVGCVYPEGLLIKNSMFSFNHSDIINLEFIGYKDDTYFILSKDLKDFITQKNNDSFKPIFNVNAKLDEDKNENVVNTDLVVDITPSEEILNTEPECIYDFDNDMVNKNNENIIKNDGAILDLESAAIKSNDIYSSTNFDDNLNVTKGVNNKLNQIESGEDFGEFVLPHYEFDENGIIINN